MEKLRAAGRRLKTGSAGKGDRGIAQVLREEIADAAFVLGRSKAMQVLMAGTDDLPELLGTRGASV